MEIFVNVTSDDGVCEWYNHNDHTGETFLHPSTELIDQSTDEFAGTPLKTVEAAKRAGSAAKSLASWNGVHKPKVHYYQCVDGKQVEVKFTRDNKIKD